jgi:hypothetical protein
MIQQWYQSLVEPAFCIESFFAQGVQTVCLVDGFLTGE